MTIDFAGSSLVDFDLINIPTAIANTTVGVPGTGLDEAVFLNISNTAAHYITAPGIMPTRNPFYMTFWNRQNSFSDANFAPFQFYDTAVSNTQPVFQIRFDNTDQTTHTYNLTAYNGATHVEVVANGNFGVVPNTVHRWDVEIFIDNVSGYFRVYVDKILLMEWTGDTNTWTATGINQWRFRSNSGRQAYLSGVITANTVLFTSQLVQNDTFAAGGINTAATGTIADIDELGSNTADRVTFNSNGQSISYTTNLKTAFETGYTVDAVVMSVSAGNFFLENLDLSLGVVIANTEYFETPSSPVNEYFFNINRILEVNPASNTAWSVSDVEGLEQIIRTNTSV